jgi:hypothetical protein
MKTINYFFEKAPLWQIYIFGWFSTGVLVASMFYFLQLFDATSENLLINGETCIKAGATLGLIFGLMILLMVSMSRKSVIFWSYAEEVEKLIDEANTKDELQSIFDNQFQELRKKCQGGPQIPEVNRLYTVMKTKYKYVN